MEKRNGLCVDVRSSACDGKAEIQAIKTMIRKENKRRRMRTIGADKGFGTREFVGWLRDRDIEPHVAKKEAVKITGLDGRTMRSQGYVTSQKIRKRVEELFGWSKSIGGLRKTTLKSVQKNQEFASITLTAYNLLRIARPCPETG